MISYTGRSYENVISLRVKSLRNSFTEDQHTLPQLKKSWGDREKMRTLSSTVFGPCAASLYTITSMVKTDT